MKTNAAKEEKKLIEVSTLATNGSGEGNSISSPSKKDKKRITASKRWCFTFNNYSKDDLATLSTKIETLAETYVYQPEVGKKGTRHIQGYIKFKQKVRPIEKVDVKGIHWEKAKGTCEENYDYCSKSDTKVGDCITNMKFKNKVKFVQYIEELYPWQEKLVNQIKAYKEDRRIIWKWETKGCTGKTTFLKYLYTHQEEIGINGMVVVSGKSADMKNCIVDFYDKNLMTPSLVVVNIPRSTNMEYVSYTGIEELKDMFFYSGKYEGGMICGARPCFIIMSNEEPVYEKMSGDRWDVENIAGEKKETAYISDDEDYISDME